MTNKDVKAEARSKLALNMHQASILYTIQFAIFSTLIALVVMSCMCLSTVNKAAAVVMICYGILLLLIAFVGSGMLGFGMTDFYLASYKCKPYNVHRLGDTLARGGVTKILLLNVQRVLLGFLLTLCLIVPGVFYLIRTSMAEHLLIANPKLKASAALKASSSVMSGKTGAYFSLVASMLGWYFLGIVTLGLGFIFIMPYINLTKTVYYKRNLQGDKAEYKVIVQPVSPSISTPSEPMQARPLREMTDIDMNDFISDEPARPIVIDSQESAIPPIDTLGSDDMAEMNAAMRDFSGIPDLKTEEQTISPMQEVPISPVSPKQKASASTSRSHDAPASFGTPESFGTPDSFGTPETPVAPTAPNAGEHKNDNDSSFVEIVKPMTTREIDEANVMGRRIDKMFSNAAAQEAPQKDYMSVHGRQAPDDFVTSEIDPITPMEGHVVDTGAQSAKPPMSDAEFDAFIKSFELPEQDEVFKPLVRTKKDDDTDAAKSSAAQPQPRGGVYTTPPITPHHSARPSSDYSAHGGEESRTERIRREREERLNNLRK